MIHIAAPTPSNEAERLQELQRLQILDTHPEPAYDDIAAVASVLCDVPIALISLIDVERQWFKACIGLDVRETPRNVAFCAHAILHPDEVMIVQDAAADPRFSANPLVTGAPHIRFYAGAPIVTAGGHTLGTVCVIDRRPRSLEPAQVQALQGLARLAARLIQQREQTTLSDARNVELQRKVSDALAEDTPEHAALRRDQRVDAVGQLTGSVAHDFNNLLQNLSMCMQLIKVKADAPDEVRRWADSGLKAVGRGAKLVAQLLTFSREQSPLSGWLCVSGHLSAMQELLRRTLPVSIRLDFRLETSGCLATVNATQLEASVLNMVINSRDALHGSGNIEINTRRIEARDHPSLKNGDYVALTISDDGPGMPAEVAARAFEPFFTTKKDGKGTGLGLSQVMGVAQRAGGTAEISSSGAGTTITMFLRIAAEGESVGEAIIDAIPDGISSRAKILVVDDVDEVRAPLAALLAAQGYAVTAVASGVDALKACEAAVPDLVLTDLGMQGMNGALLSRVLGEMHPRVPIIFMSADFDVDVVPLGLPASAVLLRKPVLVEDLVATIEQQLQTINEGRD